MQLFTYGTLMDGNCRHEVIKEMLGEYLGDFVTQDKFYLAGLNFNAPGQHFPAMIPTDPPTDQDSLEQKGWHSAKVCGEVYDIADTYTPFIDKMEAGYFRKQIMLEQFTDAEGEVPMPPLDLYREATVYLMPMGDVVTLINQVQTDWNGAYAPPLITDSNASNKDMVEWMEVTEMMDFNDNAAAAGIVVNFEDYLTNGDTLLRKGQD